MSFVDGSFETTCVVIWIVLLGVIDCVVGFVVICVVISDVFGCVVKTDVVGCFVNAFVVGCVVKSDFVECVSIADVVGCVVLTCGTGCVVIAYKVDCVLCADVCCVISTGVAFMVEPETVTPGDDIKVVVGSFADSVTICLCVDKLSEDVECTDVVATFPRLTPFVILT